MDKGSFSQRFGSIEKPIKGGTTPPQTRDVPDKKLEGFSRGSTRPKGKVTRTHVANPNTQIEDEYIHNLQQQIYFLELETKLLKDKEKERGSIFPGDGEGGPLTENFVQLKNKYSHMQRDLEAKINELAEENKELTTRNQALTLNLERAVSEHREMAQRLKQATGQFDVEGEKYRKAISTATFQKEEALKRLGEVTKERDLAKTVASELRLKFDRQSSGLKQLEDKLNQLEKRKNELLEEKNGLVISLQEQVAKLKDDMTKNTTVRNLEDTIRELTQFKNELELERDNLLNRTKSLEYTKDLIEKACTQLNGEKRQLAAKVEELKQELDKERLYQETLLNKKLKDRENRELMVANQKIEDLRKETQFHITQMQTKIGEYNKLDEEKTQLHYDLQELRANHEQVVQDLAAVKSRFLELDTEFKEAVFKNKTLEQRLKETTQEGERALSEAKSLFAENSELKARTSYLLKKLELNDQFKHIDLDELRMLSKSNVLVNDTIGQLISKWENIQSFQRQ